MNTTTASDYLLGHDDPELRRLERQAAVLDPATRAILSRAGLGPGMRVLDLGTGAGDVAMLAAEIVGPSGSVVGVDRAEDALERAARRVEARGLGNVTLVHGDVADVSLAPDDGATFDAVVGRLVLLYAADPADVLRHHADRLASGGLLLAMEYDMAVPGTSPLVSEGQAALGWIVSAFLGVGLDPFLGARLPTVFAGAGLGDPEVLAVQPYIRPGEGGWYVAETVRTLMPHIERLGIATAEEVAIDGLADRVDAVCLREEAWLKPPTLAGAWTRVP